LWFFIRSFLRPKRLYSFGNKMHVSQESSDTGS
jgi:hypothetical protein